MPTDRQPATGASSQPVVEMNIPLAHTTVDRNVVTSTIEVMPLYRHTVDVLKMAHHPDPMDFTASGFFNDLHIL
jgi:hypothetical protein